MIFQNVLKTTLNVTFCNTSDFILGFILLKNILVKLLVVAYTFVKNTTSSKQRNC